MDVQRWRWVVLIWAVALLAAGLVFRSASGAPTAPAISLATTVGTDPAICAGTTTITVGAGTAVTFCYEVSNSGTVALTRHDLADSVVGTILSNFPYTLAPGASAFLTQTTTIDQTTTNSATWSAYNPGPTDVAQDEASATVNVSNSISLAKTVGTDPAICADTQEISVAAGTAVTFCYEVSNTGLTTLTRHDLGDTKNGTILTNFPYSLAPGASAFLTQTVTINQTTTGTATWTAYNPGPLHETEALSRANVYIISAPTAVHVQRVAVASGAAGALSVMVAAAALLTFVVWHKRPHGE